MKSNISMRSLLKKHLIKSMDDIPLNHTYPIVEKTDPAGRVYWGVSTFFRFDNQPIHSNQDLSQLEWDGNEIYLRAQTEEEVTDILRKAIGILSFWKSELETRYPDTSFYLFASYDNGDMLILDEGESPIKSVTLRFWADRGDNSVINLSYFEHWEQPALLDQCNLS